MRQIIKSVVTPALKLRSNQFTYSTQTKNVFTLPKRQFIFPKVYSNVTATIAQSYTVKMLAYFFRDNIKYFTDLHVASVFQTITINKMQIDDSLHSVIVPITIQYVNSFTIQNAKALGSIAKCAAILNIQNDKFWESVFLKLDKQDVYKYITLDQTLYLLNALVEQGTFINHPLIGKLSGVVAKQKAYYQNFPHLLSLIRKTNQKIKESGPKTLQITEAYQQLA